MYENNFPQNEGFPVVSLGRAGRWQLLESSSNTDGFTISFFCFSYVKKTNKQTLISFSCHPKKEQQQKKPFLPTHQEHKPYSLFLG